MKPITEYAGSDVEDFAPAIQRSIDETGGFFIPAGTFPVSSTIILPSNKTPGFKGMDGCGFGIGMGLSKLQAVGMEGKPIFKFADGAALARYSLRDFSCTGDADHALDARGPHLYQSEFSNLQLSSVKTAVLADLVFSTSFRSVSASSVEGDCFDFTGSNTCSMVNCNAMKRGEGKTGFRLRSGNWHLLSCNGLFSIPSSGSWGEFGGNGGYPCITLDHCNIEDFGSVGVVLKDIGWYVFNQTAFQASATGEFDCFVHADCGNGAYVEFGPGTMALSKGAAMLKPAKVVAKSHIRMISDHNQPNRSASAAWPNFYSETNSVVMTAPVRDVKYTAYAKLSEHVSSFKADETL